MTHLFFCSDYCLLLLLLLEIDLFLVLKMNSKSHNNMRPFIELKAEKSPSSFDGGNIARIDEVFDLIYENSLLTILLGKLNMGTVIALVDVLEEVLDC